MTIILQDIHKSSLLRRVREHEKNGYECTCKFFQKKTNHSTYKFNQKEVTKQGSLQRTDCYSVWIVKMRKVN